MPAKLRKIRKKKTKVLPNKVEAEVVRSDGSVDKVNFTVKVLEVARAEIDKEESTSKFRPDKTDDVQPIQDVIPAPYNPLALVAIEEESNILRECVDAMVVNIGGFGHLFRPRKLPPKLIANLKGAILDEKIELETWLESLCPELSFTEMRKRMRRDLELTGNGYFEIIKTPQGEVVEIKHIPAHRMRITKLDDEYTSYDSTFIDPKAQYKLKTRIRRKRFRKFVQVDNSGRPIVWFKEYGDPRDISCTTGKEEKDLPSVEYATELIHFKIYSPRSVYGIPRWISRFVVIKGSRRSEEVNFFTLANNHVPTMFIMVEDGSLSPGSIERLQEVLDTQVSSDPNYSKVIILESEHGQDETFPTQVKGSRITIKEAGDSQKQDQMFQEYDKNNQNKVRQSFRLPPLFVGRSDDYTKATAQESRRVADEQVFAPERPTVDEPMTRLMMDEGFRFHVFKSRTPNITDNEVLAKIMVAAEKSGGMTPSRADMFLEDVFEGELGPLPEGIDLNIPYSLQFAQAQNAQRPPSPGPTPVEREFDGPDPATDGDWFDQYMAETLRGVG
jgi:PBSX family phage portal protein